jgi:hypothetical protein
MDSDFKLTFFRCNIKQAIESLPATYFRASIIDGSLNLKVEARYSSEMVVYFLQTTWCYVQEDSTATATAVRTSNPICSALSS